MSIIVRFNKEEEEIDRELYKKAMDIKSNDNSEFIPWEEAVKELDLDGE